MPTTARGTTFAVDAVEPVLAPPPTTVKTHESAARLLGAPVESCCDYSADCLAGITYHPLLSVAETAFNQHRPLSLSPDAVWLTVLQGVAQHVANHADALRGRLVRHAGRQEITVRCDGFVPGSPENPWPEVFAAFRDAVVESAGDRAAALGCDFSTTGPVERAACHVVLLGAFRPYHEYNAVAVCGIPSVTLKGDAADWRRLLGKLDLLADLDLEWWLRHLRPILAQFVRAAEGDVDRPFWSRIWKKHRGSCKTGVGRIDGWITDFLPYRKNGLTGNFTVRNDFAKDRARGFWEMNFPSGLSQVPFVFHHQDRRYAMEMLGGFVGATHDAESGAVRPKVGWAVRRGPAIAGLLLRLKEHATRPALDLADFDRLLAEREERDEGRLDLPADALAFYQAFDGADLFPQGGPALRIRPLAELELVFLPAPEKKRRNETLYYREVGEALALHRLRCRFADLPDGSGAYLNLGTRYKGKLDVVVRPAEGDQEIVVAHSFGDFLERSLSGPVPCHLRPAFRELRSLGDL